MTLPTSTTETPDSTEATAWLSPSGLARITAEVERLNRRAKRLKLPPMAVTTGETRETAVYRYIELVGSHQDKALIHRMRIPDGQKVPTGYKPTGERVTEIHATLTGQVPRLLGWTFAGVVDHLEDGNIIREVPGQSVPAEYREAGPTCDHCGTQRARRQTFVLYGGTSGWRRIGRSCLGDYLGTSDAERVAKQAELVGQAWQLLREPDCFDEDYEPCSRSRNYVDLAGFLPWVAAALRQSGYCSRRMSEDRGIMSTANAAMFDATDPNAEAPTEADHATANAARDWARALDTGADADTLTANMATLARAGYGRYEHLGLAAWMVEAYRRSIAEPTDTPPPSVHLGEIGERLHFPEATITSVVDLGPSHYNRGAERKIVMFRDGAGNVLKWFTEAHLDADVGDVVELRATVRSHDTWRDVHQTVLTRTRITARESQAS